MFKGHKGEKMMRKLNLNLGKKGFTLIEILLVVGFIALAGSGIYIVYSKVTLSNQANTEGRNLDTLRAGIKSLYASQSSTTGLTNTVVNQAQITPASMTDGTAGGILNSFGGTATIVPQNLGGTNNGFRITYTIVPSAVCTKLATGTGGQFDQLTVAGTVVKALGTTTAVDIATATAQCGGADNVTMIFDSLK